MQGPHARHEYRLGLLLVAASAIALSTAGFYSRAVGVDVWTILFWRCAFAGLLIFAWGVYSTGSRFVPAMWALGGPGLSMAACSTVATMGFIAALSLTSVANVMIIQATAPFVAAFLGRVWLKERLDGTVLVASGLAFVGVTIMVAGAYGQGSVAGDLLAIVMTAALGLMIALMLPSTATLVGGALVLAAVVGQVTRELIRQMASNYHEAV